MVNLFKHNPTISVMNTPGCGTHYVTFIRTHNSQRTEHKNIELQQKLDDFITIHDQRIIIGGDFNVIMDQNLDCAGGSPKEKESVKFVNDICLNYDLIDIWRTRNPDSTLFTWRQKKLLIQRHLDFWLFSDFCQDEVEETSIKTTIRTDHSATVISFNSLDEPRRGPSYWKFNSSLIEES